MPALILMYHRIGPIGRDPWNLAVSAEHFEQHLQRLRTFGEPMPLRRAVSGFDGDRQARPAIAVTFDDGYADNLHTAAPLLARYDVPATVFVATGYVGADREFWWDELERVLLTPMRLPDGLQLSVGGNGLDISLGAAGTYPDDDRRSDAAWFQHRRGEPSPRFAFLRTLHGRLMAASESDRHAALAEIAAWTGQGSSPRPSHLCVSRDEAVALGKTSGIELGAHTVTHPALPGLPAEAQRQEMVRSRADLQALTGEAPATFAYPFGLQSGETAGLAREAGFACACATHAGVIGPDANLFSLPRVKVTDCDGEAFEGALARWLPPPA